MKLVIRVDGDGLILDVKGRRDVRWRVAETI